jgi:hypothetical protein
LIDSSLNTTFTLYFQAIGKKYTHIIKNKHYINVDSNDITVQVSGEQNNIFTCAMGAL